MRVFIHGDHVQCGLYFGKFFIVFLVIMISFYEKFFLNTFLYIILNMLCYDIPG